MPKPASKPVRIEFDWLLRQYIENLNVTLRGFNAAEGFDFLETFVPSEDPTDSLIDLVLLARDGGVVPLTVVIGNETLSRLNLDRVQIAAGEFVKRSLSDGASADLEFSFGGESPAATRASASTLTASRTPVAGPATPVSAPAAPSTPTSRADIHPAYLEGTRRALAAVRHEGKVGPAAEGEEIYTATRDGVTLSATLRGKSGVVARAAFAGASSPTQRGVLETLCTVIEGRPILECSDHAMIAVERSLRDSAMSPPVRGLVMPENADPMFVLPQHLVRDLYAEFQKRSGQTSTTNFFDRPVSPRWQALKPAQREAELRNILASNAGAEMMELVQLDGLKRVVVHLAGDVSADEKQAAIVKLESILHQSVEPTLHVVAEVKTDRNVLRLPQRKSQQQPPKSSE